MIETLTLFTLCVLYLVFFRPGKTPPLNNPLVIDRPGKYHVTLAPHLNLAQPFVEAIAKQFLEFPDCAGDSATQFFEVRDKHTTAHGDAAYLLAITQRDGILFFQATPPVPNADHLQTISTFSQNVLSRFPLCNEAGASINQQIVSTAQQVADTKRIEITPIR